MVELMVPALSLLPCFLSLFEVSTVVNFRSDEHQVLVYKPRVLRIYHIGGPATALS